MQFNVFVCFENEPVDGEIQTGQLGECWIFESQHFGVVGRPIQIVVDWADAFATLVGVAVDGCSDNWQFGDKINAVFVNTVPVFGFVDALKQSNWLVEMECEEEYGILTCE